jgi:hypothetical protein
MFTICFFFSCFYLLSLSYSDELVQVRILTWTHVVLIPCFFLIIDYIFLKQIPEIA